VKAIIAQFKACDQVDDQTGTNTDGEAKDVDGGRCLIPNDVSPSAFEMVFEHTDLVFNQRYPYGIPWKKGKVTKYLKIM
jgi:hypothetical protein